MLALGTQRFSGKSKFMIPDSCGTNLLNWVRCRISTHVPYIPCLQQVCRGHHHWWSEWSSKFKLGLLVTIVIHQQYRFSNTFCVFMFIKLTFSCITLSFFVYLILCVTTWLCSKYTILMYHFMFLLTFCVLCVLYVVYVILDVVVYYLQSLCICCNSLDMSMKHFHIKAQNICRILLRHENVITNVCRILLSHIREMRQHQ